MLSKALSRRLAYGTGAVALGLASDHYFYCDSVTRNLRTVVTAAAVAYQVWYQFKYSPSCVDEVNEKTANLILETCARNGGLYIKFAQQIASFSAVLPPQWYNLKQLYDRAPPIPFDQVVRVIQQELGAHPSVLFDEFDETPIASASIAQVHKARLKGSHEMVAVKVQKPDVRVQVDLDLFVFKTVVHLMEGFFNLPISWTLDTLDTHIRQELDFVNEAWNAKKAASNLLENRPLSQAVHIPTVYLDLTAGRVLTAEWIDGISLVDIERVQYTWSSNQITTAMTNLVNVFSDQIFRTGFVHCDPHPGNIFVRPNPLNPGTPQLILLDHGLYIQCTPQFTDEYTRLWTSLLANDIASIERITDEWGLSDVQMSAMLTLQRSWTQDKGVTHDSSGSPVGWSNDPEERRRQVWEMQEKVADRLRGHFRDTERVPRELMFVGKNMNLVRSNNKSYGSPVNRVNLLCTAAIAAGRARNPAPPSFRQQLLTYNTLGSVLIVFQLSKFWSSLVLWWNWVFGMRKSSECFEDLLDRKLKGAVYAQTGILLQENAFD
ncbi:ABC1 family-domain-containing protein [Chytriomyces sp. MP71]|nr:ABC1 family-domain-containing protein [Chytriomyces sp. MP71]